MIYWLANQWTKNEDGECSLRNDERIYLEDDFMEDRDIWAFAYLEDERAKNLYCEPVLGHIKGRMFYEYKKRGDGLRSTSVSIWARNYADSYEQAVVGFNQLINERIEYLYKEASRLKEMLIEESESWL